MIPSRSCCSLAKMLSLRLVINEYGWFSDVIRDWRESKPNCLMFSLRVSTNTLQVVSRNHQINMTFTRAPPCFHQSSFPYRKMLHSVVEKGVCFRFVGFVFMFILLLCFDVYAIHLLLLLLLLLPEILVFVLY